MPNDCYNTIECYHEDTEIIKRLKEALSRDPPAFFAEFIPCSDYVNAYSYWGTKWDVYDVNIDEEQENSLRVSFYTAWTPPLHAYELLQQQHGFVIVAKFMESGNDFCGYWYDGYEKTFEHVSENMADVPEEFHFYFESDVEEEDEKDEKNEKS